MAMTPGLPLLPTELWRQIFDLLIPLPRNLDTSYKPPRDDYEWQMVDDGDHWFRVSHTWAMSIKITLASVSKHWRSFILPILFETIWIRSPKFAKFLRTVLPHGRPSVYCHYIRRLEMSFEGYSPGPQNTRMKRLIKLFPSLSHLSIYKHFAGDESSDGFFEALLTHCGRSLHELTLRRFHFPSHFRELLSNHAPHLEILRLGGSMDVQEGSPLILPSLHSLELKLTHNGGDAALHSLLENRILPHIRQFTPRSTFSNLEPTAPHLSGLQVLNLSLYQDNRYISKLIVANPSIVQLILSIWEPSTEHAISCPYLEEVVIVGSLTQNQRSWVGIFTFLIDRSRFPNLQRIHVVGFDFFLTAATRAQLVAMSGGRQVRFSSSGLAVLGGP